MLFFYSGTFDVFVAKGDEEPKLVRLGLFTFHRICVCVLHHSTLVCQPIQLNS